MTLRERPLTGLACQDRKRCAIKWCGSTWSWERQDPAIPLQSCMHTQACRASACPRAARKFELRHMLHEHDVMEVRYAMLRMEEDATEGQPGHTCRAISSKVLWTFSRSSPATRTELVSWSVLSFTRYSLRLLSTSCCLPFPISSFFSPSLPPASEQCNARPTNMCPLQTLQGALSNPMQNMLTLTIVSKTAKAKRSQQKFQPLCLVL